MGGVSGALNSQGHISIGFREEGYESCWGAGVCRENEQGWGKKRGSPYIMRLLNQVYSAYK